MTYKRTTSDSVEKNIISIISCIMDPAGDLQHSSPPGHGYRLASSGGVSHTLCRRNLPPRVKQLNPYWSCCVPQNGMFEFTELLFENIYFEARNSSTGDSFPLLRCAPSPVILLQIFLTRSEQGMNID